MGEKENNLANERDVEAPTADTPCPQAGAADTTAARGGAGTGFGAGDIVRRWRREDLIKRGSLVLRGLALIFSFLALIITATNKHGDWKEFDKYQEYEYLLAMSIVATVYTGAQAAKQIHEISTGRLLIDRRTASIIDFFGDQITAYLLISAASAAVPMTNRMRENAENSFTDASATAISMAFFGFVTLALSAMICGYKLSTHSYI